ncbi:MAG: TlpA family protein disulfide reductase [Desulfobacterales bacterium]|nr:TlpA family protein disulfide reductase [Desulfobacterales bacterium]
MGFPALKKLVEVFEDNDQVKFIAVQTVFDGYKFNTREKLHENQLNYSLKIPMAHETGNPDTDEIPEAMSNYRSGGTPWTVIIDPSGKVVYNDFHIKVEQAVSLIERLIAKRN